eukprot:360219-Chlamydomonas_euryale.AAC.2
MESHVWHGRMREHRGLCRAMLRCDRFKRAGRRVEGRCGAGRGSGPWGSAHIPVGKRPFAAGAQSKLAKPIESGGQRGGPRVSTPQACHDASALIPRLKAAFKAAVCEA